MFFLIGRQVATLVFFPASTPARIVSAKFNLRRRLANAEGGREFINHAHFKTLQLLNALLVEYIVKPV